MSMKSKYRLWVEKEFRDAIQQHYNLQDACTGDWEFLGCILLNPLMARDEDEQMLGKLIVPFAYIQKMYESHESAISLMLGFEKRTGIKLNITEYDQSAGMCRTIQPEIDPHVSALVDAELSVLYKDKVDRVHFATGEDFTTYKQRKYREEYLDAILNSRIDKSHPAYGVVNYLHSNRVQLWLSKQIESQCDRMAEAISNIPDGPRKKYALQVFNKIQQCAYVEYSSVENTSRIYAATSNVLALPREIRNVFYSGCYNADLKYAQLAVVAKIWDLPYTQEFLSNNGNVWIELATYLGVDADKDKDKIKKFLYPLFYGYSKSNLRKYAIEHFGDKKLMDHPMIVELLKARTAQTQKISEAKGGVDAFGQWISTEKDCHTWYEETRGYVCWCEKNSRSVLSAIVQSYEVKLMLSIFEELKKRKNLLLVGWLHDGVFLKVTHNANYANSYLDQLKCVLDAASKSMGIYTLLDIKLLE